MPRRSSVLSLPPALRAALEQRMVEMGFADYSALVAWLRAQGAPAVSRSALHRHGQQLERRIAQVQDATRAAEALMAVAPDAEASLSAATLRAAQSQLFELILAGDSEAGVDPKTLIGAVRAVADAARAGVTVQRERERVLAAAATAADDVARTAGLTADTAAAIRAAIEGAAP